MDLKELFDKKLDNAKDGKCCTNLKVVNFPEITCEGCKPRPGTSNKELDINPFLARFCLEIDILNNVYWRICHRSQDHITRLKLAIVRATVMAVDPEVGPSAMTKILMNSSYTAVDEPPVWNWIKQDQWHGNCESDLIQSPIPIDFDPTQPSVQPNFDFVTNFANKIPFWVEAHGEEINVKFDPKFNTGYLRAKYGVYAVITKDFRPTGMTFRFPSEHTINGNRYDGDMIIEFVEITRHMDPVSYIFTIKILENKGIK